MTSHPDHPKDEPSEDLERKLEKNPDDVSLKVDLGSDESMDASDPPSATQPGGPDHDEPVPSSGAPNE